MITMGYLVLPSGLMRVGPQRDIDKPGRSFETSNEVEMVLLVLVRVRVYLPDEVGVKNEV